MNDTTPTLPDLDVAIVGGGPAGLTAALFLARYLHSVVVVDSGEPRNWEARGIHGYLGLHGIKPPELRRRGREEGRTHGARYVDAEVRTAERLSDDHFRLTLDDGTRVESRRLLLAFGIKDIWPAVDGLDRCYGESVHHCPDCDGFEATGRRTAVIASGRKAVGMVLALATWTRDLVICTNGESTELAIDLRGRLDEVGAPLVGERIRRVLAEGTQVRGLELENGQVMNCERIFFAIGHYPADDLGVQLGCDRDEEGMIEIDEHYHTSVRNVFAAGDIVPGSHLALTAAADGAVAALAIHQSLLPESRRLPKRRWRVSRD
ncbi:MAG TPA: NAD(P)/FAD-dependent oxidoreductase [Gemmatimonadaceae bacterium]|nr:NAD(P)/FAD-dependent oxidoreductase [Gemmatimonadaceae bacterium]